MTDQRDYEQPHKYRIRVKGIFDKDRLAYWFENFVVTSQTINETTLIGQVPDEAALQGLLAKVSNLGLQLLLVERIEE
jgi:hypothetical protein